MAEFVVNAVVSGIVEGILGRLGSAAFNQIIGVKDELKRLHKILSAINAVLLDAEQKQSTNESVRNWLHDLKDVAYDIEDLLDLISTQDMERQESSTSLSWKITGMLSRYSLARKLKAIFCRLEDIADNQRKYSFQEHLPPPPGVEAKSETETYSFIEESHVFGRENEKEWIVSRLLTCSGLDVQHPRVVAIVGIGGMGKTTLAQLVINDPRVTYFEMRLWVYISRKFSLKTAIVNIIQSAIGENYSHLNMEALQKKLNDTLASRTFLLVLDDVWIEDSRQWLQLKELLAVGSRLSTIVMTAREERVASLTGTGEIYKLEELSKDHCWSVFVKYAFNEGEEDNFPLLVQIGKNIIRKCRGVPLAVKTLASTLRHERDYNYWKQIEKSELWEIPQGPKDILPALKLSFDHTPYHLRSCFASCAMFGKGYPLYRTDLICLWMAQGLLQLGKGSEDAIDVGYRFFNELLSRSFFQVPGYSITKKYAMFLAEEYNWMHGWVNHSQTRKEDTISQGFRSYDGKVTCVEMHDLVHDLAAYVVGEETFVVSSSSNEISSRIRHLVWAMEDLDGKDFPKGLLKARKARTFAFLYPNCCISKSFLDTLVSNFRWLRILIFRKSKFRELPDSIGNLKHLRYLDLRGNTLLQFLPRSICNLVNLKVLDVDSCIHLNMLPEHVHKLVNLKILMLTMASTRLPKSGLQGWKFLQLLKITFCPNLVSLPEEFGSLISLRLLVIRGCSSVEHLPNSIRKLTNLQHLTIHTCMKLDLSGWRGLHDLRRLRFLIFYNLPKLLEFPDGIDSSAGTLQYLRISECANLRSLPQSLKHCTSLLKLQVFNCPKLSFLPEGIDSLKALQELRILGCPDLGWRCQRDTGHDWHLICHVPEIYVDDRLIQTKNPPTVLLV